MTALELRLGNYAQDKKTGQLLIVVDLSGKEIGYMPTSNVPLPDGWQAEPIPITEDWLVKFGFVKFGSCFSITQKDEWDTPFTIQFDAQLNLFKFWSYWYKLEFLHQLQNLYFILSGQELRADGLPAFKLE